MGVIKTSGVRMTDENEEDTYTVTIPCQNCGFKKYYHLPKGEEANTYLKEEECEFCGCLVIKEFEYNYKYSKRKQDDDYE